MRSARGPQSLLYPWGNEWHPGYCCNADNNGTGQPPTMAVGALRAGDSWCGASDLAGNVWEWCADWYDEAWYAESSEDDPRGPASGSARALRGGSWDGDPASCRAAVRTSSYPGDKYLDHGFRVATTP